MYIIAVSPVRARFARLVRAVSVRLNAAVGRATDIRFSSAVLCLVAFAAGSAGGLFFSRLVSGVDAAVRSGDSFLQVYISACCNESMLPLAALEMVWPVLVFLCGFSVIGVLLIPAAAALRGFTAAFAAACFSGSLAGEGLWRIWLLLGPTAALSAPCFLTLSSASLTESRKLRSRALFGAAVRPYGARYWLLCLILALLILLSVLLKSKLAVCFFA